VNGRGAGLVLDYRAVGKRLSIPIATLMFVLLAGAAFQAPAAQRPSANIERAVPD
jgi:hypothetical protein